MAFEEDVVDLVADEVTHIGLSTNGTTEISGGGYTHQAVTYPSAASGSTDIPATLEFDGTPNSGPITHLVYKRASGAWTFAAVNTPASFNSDGRLDVPSAEIAWDL